MEKYQICEHTLGFPCISKKKGNTCYGILATTSNLGSSSNEVDIEVDQILEYLRDSYAVDESQRFHYEFRATSDVSKGTGQIQFARNKIEEEINPRTLEFKLLCDIQKMYEPGNMKISPDNLQAYTMLQNSFTDAQKWED